jgi:hypothetical protein
VFFVALLPRSWLKLGKSFQNVGEQLGGLIRGACGLDGLDGLPEHFFSLPKKIQNN